MTSLAHKQGVLAGTVSNVSQSLQIKKDDRSGSEHQAIEARELHSASITEGTKLSLNPSSLASVLDQDGFHGSIKADDQPDYKLVVSHSADQSLEIDNPNQIEESQIQSANTSST